MLRDGDRMKLSRDANYTNMVVVRDKGKEPEAQEYFAI